MPRPRTVVGFQRQWIHTFLAEYMQYRAQGKRGEIARIIHVITARRDARADRPLLCGG